VRSYAAIARLMDMGVKRVGASHTERILAECREAGG
jgi:deoxyribose-phosphate aldolase